MGAHWAEAAALDAVVTTLQATTALAEGLSGAEALWGAIAAFSELRERSTVLDRLRAEGLAP